MIKHLILRNIGSSELLLSDVDANCPIDLLIHVPINSFDPRERDLR